MKWLADLDGIRRNALTQDDTVPTGKPVGAALVTKGVNFGHITARPDGLVDTAEVDGVELI